MAIFLSACGSADLLPDSKVNYKSEGAKPTTKLDVPPDLSQLAKDARYSMPGGISANDYNKTAPKPGLTPNAVGDVRLERSGQLRWLVIDRSADELYPLVRDFWLENGFTLVQEQAPLGFMETEWAENRAKIPQDFLRRTLGKVMDGMYSTGERDKFRTNIEPVNNQSTEIRISHRGLAEVFAGSAKDSIVWQPRPNDPGLENEFMRRLMIKLGAPVQQANAVMSPAQAAKASGPKAETIDGVPSISMVEGFDVAWRRLGLALDRTGFTVEDRDRKNGTYFVRYVEPVAEKEGNFIKRWFSSTPKQGAPVRYRLVITPQGGGSRIQVLLAQGQAANTLISPKIATLLLEELK